MLSAIHPSAARRRTALGILGAVSLTIGMGLITGCAQAAAHAQATPKDGELALPAHYQRWPRFIQHINKTEHVRNIYVNCIGASSIKGEPMANGSKFVMEIYNAKKDAGGQPIKDADGNLVKGDLSKIFVMGKDEGWGAGSGVSEDLLTGDWIYSAYNGDGSKAQVQYNTCRGCHVPLKDDDFVFHYDQYFR